MTKSELDKSLSKAQIQIMLDTKSVFISSVMLNLKIEFNENISTACTDGLSIQLSPDFWAPLSMAERIGLLLHETWHVCFDHVSRAQDARFEHEKANMAMDHEINLMLLAQGYKIPEGGCADKQYTGMHFEKIYELLPDEPESDDYEPDIVVMSEEQAQEVSEKVKDIIMTAHSRTEMQGATDTIPSHLLREIEKVKNPKLPWFTILRNYLNDRAKEDYSWARPNPMFSDIYIPSLYSEGMGEIKVYEDLSGSITDKEHSMQVAEMRFIKEIMSPSLMTFNGFTTVLGETQLFQRDEEITPDWNMTGGTCIGPVIQDIRESDAEVAIIFTDGYFSHVDYAGLGTDVIWVIINNSGFTCPIGKIIHMEI